MTVDSRRKPSLLSRLVWRILLGLYRWKGWRFEGAAPDVRKCVILGAPHTSNWDFIFVLGAAQRMGIPPGFIGKHTLFKWPMGGFMRDMGGISIERGRRGGNYVQQIAEAFDRADELALVIAPEGSRSGSGEWKSGFYHIAMAANVPIVPAWVDHENLRGGIGEPLWPSGDYSADLAKLASFYREKRPDCARFLALEESARMMGGPDVARGENYGDRT